MAITPEQKVLARHRFERAETALYEAIIDKDSSKHSGVLSLFNQHFIKTEIVSEISFKSIQSLMDLRHEGDYQDFSEITREEDQGSVETAKLLIDSLRDVLDRLLATPEIPS